MSEPINKHVLIRRYGLPVLITTLVLIVIAGIVVATTPGTTTTHNTDTSGCNGNVCVNTSYAAANDTPQPTVLLDLTGNGNVQTKSFSAVGNWTIAYSYDCSNFGQAGTFSANIENTDGSASTDTGPDEDGLSGNATSYEYEAGEHYLSIVSECKWHVVVKG